jgi:protein subunit release factor A
MFRSNYNYVRVVHISTGISFVSDQHRSQRRNLNTAMEVIKARLWASKNIDTTEKLVRSYRIPDGEDYKYLDTHFIKVGPR